MRIPVITFFANAFHFLCDYIHDGSQAQPIKNCVRVVYCWSDQIGMRIELFQMEKSKLETLMPIY